LPHVPMDVVEAPGVRFLLAHRMRRAKPPPLNLIGVRARRRDPAFSSMSYRSLCAENSRAKSEVTKRCRT
jgi:hypothetical protein